MIASILHPDTGDEKRCYGTLGCRSEQDGGTFFRAQRVCCRAWHIQESTEWMRLAWHEHLHQKHSLR